MSASYIPSDDAGKVRLLAADTPTEDGEAVFDDDEIDAFLALRGGDPVLAAASALRAVAASEALLSKKIRLQDVETDGPAVSRELRLQADRLEEQADSDYDFGWAPIVASDFAWRQRVWNERRRDAG